MKLSEREKRDDSEGPYKFTHTASHRAMILARLFEEWIGQHGHNRTWAESGKGVASLTRDLYPANQIR